MARGKDNSPTSRGSAGQSKAGSKKKFADLFDKSGGAGFYRGEGKTRKILSSASLDEVGREIESPSYVKNFTKQRDRFFPNVDFSKPENFAKFGSAREYYERAVQNIYKFYPYDGSLKEKLEWHNSSSYLDNYILENEYPRTNGNIQIGHTWGTTATTINSGDGLYKKSATPQYISVKGGPNGPTIPAYASGSEYDKGLYYKFKEQKANVYDSELRQQQNFTIDGTTGNTVEFWLKLPTEPSKSQTSPAHAYFDLWNENFNYLPGSNRKYGRLLIESIFDVDGSGDPDGSYLQDSVFYVSYSSGSNGVSRAKVGPTSFSGNLGIDLSDWNHYAFVMQNNPTGSDHLLLKMYVNGVLADTVHTGSQISSVETLPLNATIGAYRTGPTPVAFGAGVNTEGFGTLSGSFIDEFRFWKSNRSSKQISRNWFTQVAGGTNTDYGNIDSKFTGSSNPVDLGVYYKFNEGITQTSSLDRVALDYSGRVSNGFIKNYTAGMRLTTSAIVESSASISEFRDPIIYSRHPDVVEYEASASIKGREYDGRNSGFMYNTLPSWLIDLDETKERKTILALNQIMASYFDELCLQIKKVPTLKNIEYFSGSVSGSTSKPLPFASRLLTSHGFVAPEIFADATALESLANRNDERNFQTSLENIKNQIYTNIYNNLTYINKSKGTEKAIRNLIRCYGVDDDLYSLNMYADNATISLSNSSRPKVTRKTYADFSSLENFDATVYNFPDPDDSNSTSFLTGSTLENFDGFDSQTGMTLEAEVIFPKRLSPDFPNYRDTVMPGVSSSLFGMHTAVETSTDYVWSANDFANFQVYAVKSQETGPSSKDVFFILTSSNPNSSNEGIFTELTTSVFKDVYNNQKWNFAVKIKPERYPTIGILSGSHDGASAYDVEFFGVCTSNDQIVHQFRLTGAVGEGNGLKFSTSRKRVYVGAHRTNFSGTLLNKSDVKVSSCRYWSIPLENEEIVSHAMDPRNYGVFNAMQNSFLNQSAPTFPQSIEKINTLAMHWDFDTVTGSDSNGRFIIKDISSGSTDARYGDKFSNLLLKTHTARGDFFKVNSTSSLSREYVQGQRQQVPENLNSFASVNILSRDDENFTTRTKPIKFTYSVEKSMYQTISEEMINFLAAASDASAMENLLGDPINKYRGRYKSLEKIRRIFFDKVGNTPNLDKYLDYFKWLDSAVSEMVQQLAPISSKITDVSNIVESHLFERGGKYEHKFPTMHFGSNDPSGSIRGINELLYDWEFGHAPTPPSLGVAATTTITATAAPTVGKEIVLRQLKADGSIIAFTFTVTATTTSGNDFARTGADHGLSNLKTLIDGSGIFTTSAVQNLGGGSYRLTLTQNFKSVLGNTLVTSNVDNYTVAGAAGAAANGEFSGGITRGYQEDNCLWWSKKATRDDAFLPVGDTGVDSSRMEIHSASLQVFNRRFNSPYKIGGNEGGGIIRRETNVKAFSLTETPPFDNSRGLKFNTTTFASASDCKDLDKINPNRQYKTDYQVMTRNDATRIYAGKLVGNYQFVSSSQPAESAGIPDGYTVDNQHLRDYYTLTKDVPIQGPFTEAHVGGNSHRHVGINTGLATIRPEAFYTNPTIAGGNIFYNVVNPSFVSADAPRKDYTRDFIAKSPVNIKNIKNITSSALPNAGVVDDNAATIPLGNYSHNYEIVQIPGRDINNRFLAQSGNIDTTFANSPSVLGLLDYKVPDRGKTTSIMVSRFSAPGGPEVSCPAFMDAASETFAPYNALPFRNLTVRQPLRGFLTRHSPFGGLSAPAKATVSIGTSKPTNGQTIVIVSTDGTSVTYTASSSGTNTALGQFDISNDADDAALGLKQCIEATQGHGGKIIVTLKSDDLASGNNVVVLTQLDQGVDGNTNIVSGLSNTIVEGFSDGRGPLGSPTGSFHKTQRNTRKIIKRTGLDTFGTASLFDNYFVQHAIPQSELQYSWITSSAIQFPFGYSERDFSNASEASTDITFLSASELGLLRVTSSNFFSITSDQVLPSYASFIPQDFVGLNNILVARESDLTENTIHFKTNTTFLPFTNFVSGAVSSSTFLNVALLKANGPYGNSSWKQVRQMYNPLVRYFKKNNIISLAKVTSTKLENIADSTFEVFADVDVLETHIEPPVTFKYKPLNQQFTLKTGDKINLKSTFGNNLSTFANKDVDAATPRFSGRNLGDEVYDDLKNIYLYEYIPPEESPFALDNLDANKMEYLKYSEVVYPKEELTGLAKIRGRGNYTVSSGSSDFNQRLGLSRAFWKHDINDRIRANITARNSSDLAIASGSSYFGMLDLSIWPLDAEEPFFDLECHSASAANSSNGSRRFDPVYWSPLGPSGAQLNPSVEPRWNDVAKNGELSYAGWLYSLLQIQIQGKVRVGGSSDAASAPTGSGPIEIKNTDGFLRVRPSASIQYEFPNIIWSGSFAYGHNTGTGAGSPYFTQNSLVRMSASLHLIPPYRTDVLSGRTPWFDSYEDYAQDIRSFGKDYTVLPEFRITEHIDYYLDKSAPGSKTNAVNNDYATLVGASTDSTSSATNPLGGFNSEFMKTYHFTDFMKHFKLIKEDHEIEIGNKKGAIGQTFEQQESGTTEETIITNVRQAAKFSKIRLECEGIKKLLPYQGFYPVLRAVQLGNLFSASYGSFITGSNTRDGDQERLAALYQPFFAPGIFFNTIKSGIAVDYAVHTGSVPQFGSDSGFIDVLSPLSGATFPMNVVAESPNYVFPFEAILNPDSYLPVSSSDIGPDVTVPSASVFFTYPHFTGSVRPGQNKVDCFYADEKRTPDEHATGTGSAPQIFFEWLGQSDIKYSLAANNFFAEVQNFFLEKKGPTSFLSKPESQFRTMTSGSSYYMDVVLYKTDDFVSYEGPSGSFFFKPGGDAVRAVPDALNESRLIKIGDRKIIGTAKATITAATGFGNGETITFFDSGGNSHVFTLDTSVHPGAGGNPATSGAGKIGIRSITSANDFAEAIAIAVTGSSASGGTGFDSGVNSNIVTVYSDEPGPAGNRKNASTVGGSTAVGAFKGGRNTPPVSVRGIHYGPPYKPGTLRYGVSGTGSADFPLQEAWGEDPSYAIHTPPYFYGDAVARIEFKPHEARDLQAGESAKFTLQEILSNAAVNTAYKNNNKRAKSLQNPDVLNAHPAGISQMQISSSVNLFGSVTLKEIGYSTEQDANGNYIPLTATTPVIQDSQDAWVIESKFECPSVNLHDMDVASLGAGSGLGKEKLFTKGIWKGYGHPPTGASGIFMQVRESYPQKTFAVSKNALLNPSVKTALTGSLINVCGFKATQQRVGEIAPTKQIGEAIVAIPIDSKGFPFFINENTYKQQILQVQQGKSPIFPGQQGSEIERKTTSISKMFNLMRKYYIPPDMDFSSQTNILALEKKPFVMYIFEFTHDLTKDDLSNIWQNIMPEISVKAEKQKSVFEHLIGPEFEFFGDLGVEDFPTNIRWKVFKVKQRARNNYFNITKTSETGKGFSFSSNSELEGFGSDPQAELPFSYNWPYDFFSLVELAKMNSEVTFTRTDDDPKYETFFPGGNGSPE